MAYRGSSAYSYVSPTQTTEIATLHEPAIDMWFREYGRHYNNFRPRKYLQPCDEEEMDRMDILHQFFLVARARDSSFGGLYQKQIPSHPHVLDLGCGTGIWAIDVADRHDQKGFVLGWDISLIQPQQIPHGLKFERRDIEEPWAGVQENSFDLIHMCMLAGSIENWPRMYSQIFRYLKPGTGYLEHVEIDFTPKCDGGGLPPDSKLRQWSNELTEAMARAGRRIDSDPNTTTTLRNLGYVEISETKKNIPFNQWPVDEHDRIVGKWFNLAITRGLEAMSLAPLSKFCGWTQRDIAALCEQVKTEMSSRSIEAYCTMYIWTAKRPPLPQQA